ncbi:MAG: hypothetical protein AB1553_05635 [Nitrospirota bacterium]
MKSTVLKVRISEQMSKQIKSAASGGNVSDYVREAIKKSLDDGKEEAAQFLELVQKLDASSLPEISEKVDMILHEINELREAQQERISPQRQTKVEPSAKEEKLKAEVLKIAKIMAINAKMLPAENSVFGPLINDNFEVERPLKFIYDYLRHMSKDRLAVKQKISELFPDFLK